MAIATAQEVADHAGVALAAGEAALVDAQVVLYQAELESILGRGVTKLSRVESVWCPLGVAGTPTADRWYARRGPVHSITGITAGGLAVASTSYARNRNGAEVAGVWTDGTEVVVTYVGGWDAPDNLPAKSAVVARAARWLNRRRDDDVGTESSTVEGHSVKWMADSFTEAELRACSRLRAPDQAG